MGFCWRSYSSKMFKYGFSLILWQYSQIYYMQWASTEQVFHWQPLDWKQTQRNHFSSLQHPNCPFCSLMDWKIASFLPGFLTLSNTFKKPCFFWCPFLFAVWFSLSLFNSQIIPDLPRFKAHNFNMFKVILTSLFHMYLWIFNAIFLPCYWFFSTTKLYILINTKIAERQSTCKWKSTAILMLRNTTLWEKIS